jgi:hypothetical protein
MFLKLRPLLCSLVFLAGLELIVFFHRHVFIVALFLLIFSFYEGWKLGGRWKFSVLPTFFAVSSVSLLYLIALNYEQQVFILLATFIYYLSVLGAYRLNHYDQDKTARGMIMAATVATLFFAYSSAYGLYLNFLVPLYSLMLAYLFVTALVSYQYFSIIYSFAGDDLHINPNLNITEFMGEKTSMGDKKSAWIYSLLLALIMSELIWTMNFWPFGYLTTGVIALILYYTLWDIVRCYFLDSLNKKRVIGNVILFMFLIGFVLTSAKWIPVI